MSVTFSHRDECETAGKWKLVRRTLGLRAFGVSLVDIPPGEEIPEHDVANYSGMIPDALTSNDSSGNTIAARFDLLNSLGLFTLPNGAKRSPDAAWVRRNRWDALTEVERESFVPLCPDFVLELRSATDRLSFLKDKMQEYIANGAPRLERVCRRAPPPGRCDAREMRDTPKSRITALL